MSCSSSSFRYAETTVLIEISSSLASSLHDASLSPGGMSPWKINREICETIWSRKPLDEPLSMVNRCVISHGSGVWCAGKYEPVPTGFQPQDYVICRAGLWQGSHAGQSRARAAPSGRPADGSGTMGEKMAPLPWPGVFSHVLAAR